VTEQINGHDPGLMVELFAWAAVDVKGHENVSAIFRGDAWMPLVSKTVRPLRAARDAVQTHANATGHPHRLLRISANGRQVLDEVLPVGPRPSGLWSPS
jgi:hypothetical protein